MSDRTAADTVADEGNAFLARHPDKDLWRALAEAGRHADGA